MGGHSVSPDNNLLVYGVDTVSRRHYTLYLKDLSTGELLEYRIPETTGGATWANDNKTLFYTKNDPMTLRSFQIYKHVLGTPVSEDVLVFEEKDETFSCGIGKTKSEEFLVIGTSTTVSSEFWVSAANSGKVEMNAGLRPEAFQAGLYGLLNTPSGASMKKEAMLLPYTALIWSDALVMLT